MSSSDLTAKARIRRAAVARFGRDGFSASVRTIASDAGVSGGLVIKHFGSKDGLREACDADVLTQILEAKRASVANAEQASANFLGQLGHAAEYRPQLLYVLRTVQEGGPSARRFLDHMIEDAIGYVDQGVQAGLIRPSRDEAVRARYLVQSAVGAMTVAVAQADSDDVLSDAFWERIFGAMALPALELFTEGFFTDGTFLESYLLYVTDPPEGAKAPTNPGSTQPEQDSS